MNTCQPDTYSFRCATHGLPFFRHLGRCAMGRPTDKPEGEVRLADVVTWLRGLVKERRSTHQLAAALNNGSWTTDTPLFECGNALCVECTHPLEHDAWSRPCPVYHAIVGGRCHPISVPENTCMVHPERLKP